MRINADELFENPMVRRHGTTGELNHPRRGRGGRSACGTVPQYRFGMDYSFSAPSAMEFKTLYDETGWGDWALDRLSGLCPEAGSSAPSGMTQAAWLAWAGSSATGRFMPS